MFVCLFFVVVFVFLLFFLANRPNSVASHFPNLAQFMRRISPVTGHVDEVDHVGRQHVDHVTDSRIWHWAFHLIESAGALGSSLPQVILSYCCFDVTCN